jgi:hypothetical protein
MSERNCEKCREWVGAEGCWENIGCQHSKAKKAWHIAGHSVGQNLMAEVCKHYAEPDEQKAVEKAWKVAQMLHSWPLSYRLPYKLGYKAAMKNYGIPWFLAKEVDK